MGKPIPQTIGQLANVVYYSLAQLYAKTIEKLQAITGIEYKVLNVVGGGSQNVYLNALTKKATKKVVMAGPTEGTAAGNVLAQAISSGQIKDIKQGRKIINDSFGISEVE
jgi:rhamnulokinase